MAHLTRGLRAHRAWLSTAFDVGAWLFGFATFAWLRLDTVGAHVPWVPVLSVVAVTIVIFLTSANMARLHQGRARTGSLDEMVQLGLHVGGAGAVVFGLNLVFGWIPRSVPAGATLLTLALAAWARVVWRRLSEAGAQQCSTADSERVVVIGAGEAGRELLSSMQRDGRGRWSAVALLDDDPYKRHRRIQGVPVVGTTDALAEVAGRLGARTVVLAIPSASAETIERLRLAARAAHLRVKVLPSTTELLDYQVGIRDLRDINLADVLGRNQIDTDVDAIAHYLRGRRVLVTGAGGSIGSELCRQILRYEPGELVMLDRDESALHALQLSIHGRALLDSDEVVLCDIRDESSVRQLFEERRPEVVFHAAALKHLPMLEQYPAEAIKTNIIGTRNVIDAADSVGVDRFVNISTDKAANPVSVLGYSKRIAECLTAQRADTATGTYLSVRFGNVLGSRGSVLTAFAQQIASGGPVTVTHPDITRFFMTIEEACQLVVQAAAIGKPGEALVLDMGEPVSIVAVAERLIEQSESDIAIEFTGLRDGEKLHEELFGEGEPLNDRREHPLVSHVPVPILTDDEIDTLPRTGDSELLRAAMRDLCAVVAPEHLERDYASST